MDKEEDLKKLKDQLNKALQEEPENQADKEELKKILEALEGYDPEIREAWTLEDERIFAQKGKPRVAHKPSDTTRSPPAEIPPQVPPVNNKSVRPSGDLWKGVFEKNYKLDKSDNK